MYLSNLITKLHPNKNGLSKLVELYFAFQFRTNFNSKLFLLFISEILKHSCAVFMHVIAKINLLICSIYINYFINIIISALSFHVHYVLKRCLRETHALTNILNIRLKEFLEIFLMGNIFKNANHLGMLVPFRTG